MPFEQASTVQALPSLAQSAAVVHGSQPAIAVSWQLWSAPHTSVVQAFESSQSAASVQGVQPSTTQLPQTLESQVSGVQDMCGRLKDRRAGSRRIKLDAVKPRSRRWRSASPAP